MERDDGPRGDEASSRKDDTEGGNRGGTRGQTLLLRLAGTAAVVIVALGAAASTGYAQSRGESTEYHEVTEGDTLYDLSGQYFGDVKMWPELWSYNPHVTNPHWIYPGDIVYLDPPGEPKKAAEQKEGETKLSTGKEEQVEGLRVNTVGFVEKDRTPFVGRILASPKEARLLGEYDSAWVGFGEDAYGVEQGEEEPPDEVEIKDPGEVKKGSRFAIVEPAGELENDDNDVIGYKYVVLGSLVVTKTSEEKFDTALVDQSWREIERGSFLVPYEKQLKLVEHTKASESLVAEIIGSLSGYRNFAQSHFVFIDKGAEAGVRPGNRLYIYQREAGLPNRWGAETPKEIPWQRIGHIRVIDTTKNFATAIVVKSKSEIEIGDRLEMYKGD